MWGEEEEDAMMTKGVLIHEYCENTPKWLKLQVASSNTPERVTYFPSPVAPSHLPPLLHPFLPPPIHRILFLLASHAAVCLPAVIVFVFLNLFSSLVY